MLPPHANSLPGWSKIVKSRAERERNMSPQWFHLRTWIQLGLKPDTLDFTVMRTNKYPFKDLNSFNCVSVNCQNLDQLNQYYISSNRNKVTLERKNIISKQWFMEFHVALCKPMPSPLIFISHFYQLQRIELKWRTCEGIFPWTSRTQLDNSPWTC